MKGIFCRVLGSLGCISIDLWKNKLEFMKSRWMVLMESNTDDPFVCIF